MLEKILQLFDFNAVIGRIRLIFLTFVLITGGICLFFAVNIYAIFNESVKLQNETRALEYTSNQLLASLNTAFSNINLFVIYPHEIYRNKTVEIYKTETMPILQTLKLLSENEDIDPHIKTQINEIEDYFDKINDVFTTQINTLDRVSLKNTLNSVLLFNINMINKRAKNIAITHRQKEQIQQVKLSQKIDSLLWTILGIFSFFAVLAMLAMRNSIQTINRSIAKIQGYSQTLKEGNIPEVVVHVNDEFDVFLKDIETLSNNLDEMKNFMMRIAEAKIDEKITGFKRNSQLGEVIFLLKEQLLNANLRESRREWENKGINLLSKTIREHPNNIQNLCDHLLEELVAYISCVQGGIFIHYNNNDYLELRSSFAYGRKKFLKKQIDLGEGIIGEVFRDGEIVIITDVPENYFEVMSGLGKSDPKYLAIVPLKTQEIIVGVLELASFEPFEQHHLAIFERVSEVLASSIASVSAAEQTKNLLDEAREYAQRMNAQEEELRQNTEELLATREALEKQVQDLHTQIVENELILDQIKAAFIMTDVTGKIVSSNQAFEDIFGYDKAEIIEMPLFKVIPEIKGLNRISREDAKKFILHPFKAIKKDGTFVYVQANVSRIDYLSDQRFVILVARANPGLVLQN